MKRSEKLSAKLRIRLTLIFFNVLLVSGIITTVIFFVLSTLNILIYPGKIGSLGYVIALFITSLIIGTIFGYFLTDKYFRPLKKLSDATKKNCRRGFYHCY